jgi:hypothetical protein
VGKLTKRDTAKFAGIENADSKGTEDGDRGQTGRFPQATFRQAQLTAYYSPPTPVQLAPNKRLTVYP